MSGARLRAIAVAAVLAAIAAFAFAKLRAPTRLPVRTEADKPTLLLLTSLPILFGEDFSLKQDGSPALAALQARYRVVPISLTDPAELAKGRLILMAQPQAQPPEDLVALDQWVRAGGHLLLLADPLLEWPSQRPFGDPLRPPAMFADTGLLAHWGLRLDAPDERGIQWRLLGGKEIETASPGRLVGSCVMSADRLTARCAVGKGKATIVADADFLNIEELDGRSSENLSALAAELAALE